jgi:hypothetical protein
MVGIGASTIQVFRSGLQLSARVYQRPDAMRAILTPAVPLPTGATVEVRLGDALRDLAGNRSSLTGWTFQTAPGLAYSPARAGILARGNRAGYRISQSGDLLDVRNLALTSPKHVHYTQRATMPNLPGRWLYAENGPLAGRWVREGASQHVNGETARVQYGTLQRLRLEPGTQVGYRFDSFGSATSSRSVHLTAVSWADTSVRAVVNGTTYWRVASGPLTGFWVPQSSMAHRRGSIDKLLFTAPPRIDLAAGTYTGYRFDYYGRVTSSLTSRTTRTTIFHVSGWAVINGRPYFLVSSGTWAGTWLPETSATRLHV